MRRRKHLYRDGAKGPELREFERKYGKRKGRRVYGATVGKVRREQEAEEEHDPPRSSTGTHLVEGHWVIKSNGRRYYVDVHEARNPRRAH